MRLDHVQLHVADIARSRAFYGEHFGLTETVHEDPGLVILAAPGGGLLALHPAPTGDGAGSRFHFGFRVTDADAVREHRARFTAAGLHVLDFYDQGTFAWARIEDPDGHHVEVYAY